MRAEYFFNIIQFPQINVKIHHKIIVSSKHTKLELLTSVPHDVHLSSELVYVWRIYDISSRALPKVVCFQFLVLHKWGFKRGNISHLPWYLVSYFGRNSFYWKTIYKYYWSFSSYSEIHSSDHEGNKFDFTNLLSAPFVNDFNTSRIHCMFVIHVAVKFQILYRCMYSCVSERHVQTSIHHFL